MRHRLAGHRLLTVDALARAADAGWLTVVEQHRGNLPLVHPSGRAAPVPGAPGAVLRDLTANGAWVLLRVAAGGGAYAAVAAEARRLAGDGHAGVQVIAAGPHAVAPVHADPYDVLLLQVAGTKRVATGTFDDPVEAQREIEARVGPARRNASRLPDRVDEVVLGPGDVLRIPAFTFHWVRGDDGVSVTVSVGTRPADVVRAERVHACNARLRQLRLRPAPPGVRPRVDRAKAAAVAFADRVRGR